MDEPVDFTTTVERMRGKEVTAPVEGPACETCEDTRWVTDDQDFASPCPDCSKWVPPERRNVVKSDEEVKTEDEQAWWS